jgi:LytS/YehU family sensor histidine kinase
MINLDEEVERLKNYLELEQIRLEGKFDYYIEVDPILEEEIYNVPSMMIQPFLENAIWHGISNLNYKGVVSLGVYRFSENIVKVTIEDNGPGIKKKDDSNSKSEVHLNMGMNMTKKRLELLSKKFQVHSKLVVDNATSNPDCPGTKVTIYLPYILGGMTSQDAENQEYIDTKEFKSKKRK